LRASIIKLLASIPPIPAIKEAQPQSQVQPVSNGVDAYGDDDELLMQGIIHLS